MNVAVFPSSCYNCGITSVPAEDGVMLEKIEKVKVLRNDQREGK